MALKYFFYIILIIYALQFISFPQKREQLITHWRGDKKTYYFTETSDWSAHKLSFAVKAGREFTYDRLIWKRNALAGGDSSQIYASYSSTTGKTTFAITILQIDAEDLPGTDYVWDLEATDTSDTTNVTTLFDGTFRIKPDTQTRFDGVNIPPAGTRFYWAPLDSSDQEPGFLLGRNSNNSADWISVDSTKDLLNIPADTHSNIDSLFRKTSNIVKIEDYMIPYDTSLGWSFVIQAAVDANLGTGNILMFNGDKVYGLQFQKADPYGQATVLCVDGKTGGINIYIPRTTTIRLKNDVQVGDTSVNIFAFGSGSDIHLYGGGTIDANSQNQPRSTLTYATQGNIIFARNTSRIYIEDLTLKNTFGHPIFTYVGCSDIYVNKVNADRFGEAMLFYENSRIWVNNCYITDFNGVTSQDGIEPTNSTNFIITNNTIVSNRLYGGQAIDIASANTGIVSDNYIKGWAGVGISTQDGLVIDNIIIANNMFDSCSAAITQSHQTAGNSFRRLKVTGNMFNNCGGIFYALQGDIYYPDIYWSGNTHIGNSKITLMGNIRATFKNNTFKDMPSGAITIGSSGYVSIDSAYADISNNTFTNVRDSAIFIDPAGRTDYLLSGFITNNNFNNSNIYIGSGAVGLNNTPELVISDNNTTRVSTNNLTHYPRGNEVLISNANSRTWATISGSLGKNQKLELRFEHNEQIVVDYRVSTSNIMLRDARNARFDAGDRLYLERDPVSGYFKETSRISLYKPKSATYQLLHPTISDTLFINRFDGDFIVDSVWFKSNDSAGVYIAYGINGADSVLLNQNPAIINGEVTKSSPNFYNKYGAKGFEMYLYLKTYIGDNLSSLRFKLFWREK